MDGVYRQFSWFINKDLEDRRGLCIIHKLLTIGNNINDKKNLRKHTELSITERSWSVGRRGGVFDIRCLRLWFFFILL